MSAAKPAQQLARQLFRLSLVNGELSAERVGGVLEYVEKHCAHPHAVLSAYHRLVAAEVARGQALIEHAGPVSPAAIASIVSAMTQRYGRRIAPLPQRNDALLAGVRVRVGDDLYESSVAGHLSALASAT
ncbi:MAG TPA: F0F1 ATP synthase subunit delta [Opitutaceae bacterium]|nr:F0F1 ATP synthase subunit delta [Opitutaceae bacterium]